MFGKTQRGVSKRSNKSLIPKWLGTLVVILIMLFIAILLLLWKPWKPVPATGNAVTSPHYQEEETNQDYRFYDLLPQQQVTPIPEQAVPEIKKEQAVVIVEAKPSATTGSNSTEDDVQTPAKSFFMLQVRSYPDPDSADTRRAEIILSGLSADVVKSSENGKTWYRVVSGPYDSQHAAVAAQRILQDSGIDSIVVKH